MNRAATSLIPVMGMLLVACQSNMEKRDGVAPATAPAAATVTQSPPPPADSPSAPRAREESPASTPYTEKLGQDGIVDWTAGVVTATGEGYPPAPNQGETLNPRLARQLAKRAATAIAYRNLLEAFTTIRVDSTTTVSNYVMSKDEIEVKFSGMVHGITEIESHDLPNQGYRVKLQMKLTGEASGALAPKDARPAKRLVSDNTSDAPVKKGVSYTGLVVDARGMGLRPALVPRILTEDGQEAYSQSYVLAKYRQNEGIAAYVTDPREAKTHPKVMSNPLFVKALGPAKDSHTDLVISNAAAQTIHGVKDHFEFLEKAQVIVIIDRSRQ